MTYGANWNECFVTYKIVSVCFPFAGKDLGGSGSRWYGITTGAKQEVFPISSLAQPPTSHFFVQLSIAAVASLLLLLTCVSTVVLIVNAFIETQCLKNGAEKDKSSF